MRRNPKTCSLTPSLTELPRVITTISGPKGTSTVRAKRRGKLASGWNTQKAYRRAGSASIPCRSGSRYANAANHPSGRAHWRLRTRPREDRGNQSIVRIAVVETAAIRSNSGCSNSVGIYPRMASWSYHPGLYSNTAALASARVTHDSVDALRHHRTRPSGSAPGGWIRGIAIVSAGDARPLVRRRSARPEEPDQFVKAIAVVRR